MTDADLAQAQRDLHDATARNQRAKQLLEIQSKRRALDKETARTEQLLKTPPKPQAGKRPRPLSRHEDNAEPRPAAPDNRAGEPQVSGSGVADLED